MKSFLYFIAFIVWAGLFLPEKAEAAGIVEIVARDNKATISLNLPDISPNKVFIVSNPERLVVDVPAVAERPKVGLPKSYKGQLIRDVRFGQFSPDTYRFVFDLTLPAEVLGVTEKRRQLEIVITPSDSAHATAAKTEKKAEGKSEPLAASQPSKASSEKSPADIVKKQVSNQKPLIMIDPGHGGMDPGTIGPKGAYEKDLVLAYAKALRTELLKTGRYRVELTRVSDRFIMLRERVKMARNKKADLFISIHADSAPEASARGLSVYTLSEKASDEEAAALAAQENKADVLAGIDLSEEREDVADILISLAQRDTTNRSAQLADLLVYSLDGKVRLLPNSHRFAGFAVLKAPDIPSVLVEIGFLSHTSEEKLLRSKSYRTKIIKGIVAGVDSYFGQYKLAGE